MDTEIRTRVGELLNSDTESSGDRLNQLMDVLYGELRGLAGALLRKERPGHTLQPTALVNEAFIRLHNWKDLGRHRAAFFRIVALTYRRILVDHARKRAARLRSEERKLLIDVETLSPGLAQVDMLALNEAISELEKLDERQALVTQLRLFLGLTPTEIADISPNLTIDQVKYAWKIGSLWLVNRLLDGDAR